jgi:hypothetical protein
MNSSDIVNLRLATQHITSALDAPEQVVYSMGSMQAQDYQASLWAIALRSKYGTTKSDVENAISKRKIVRTWLMRGTLHFASSQDIRWMIKLFGKRLLQTARQRDAHLGLSDKTVEKTMRLFYNALKGGNTLTRSEMYKILENGGVPSKNNLGYHMLYRAAWDGLICFAAHDGKEQTFALLDEWIPKSKELSNDQAIAELAYRYFSSHGPATIRDYVWWSGLTVKDARLGIEKNESRLDYHEIDGKRYYTPKRMPKIDDNAFRVHLLPAFDEYLVSYADRSAMLGNPEMQKAIKRMIETKKLTIIHSNGIFSPVIIVDGLVVGTWRKRIDKNKLIVSFTPYVKISKDDMKLAKEEAVRYGRFLEMDVVIRP